METQLVPATPGDDRPLQQSPLVALSQPLWLASVSAEDLARTPQAVLELLRSAFERIRELEKVVADLTARLNTNSSNSSLPPSKDPPWAKPTKKPKPPSGRRRGGQKGHAPHQRELVPIGQVRKVHHCAPSECKHCGCGLGDADNGGLEARRHQILEWPEVSPYVDEYQLQSRLCPKCMKTTAASLPAGVPESHFGPRLEAFVAILVGRYRISKRDVRDLLQVIAGADISLGGLCDLEARVASALEVPVEEVHEALRESSGVVHQDETSWRERNQKAWLWVTVGGPYCYYKIDAHRSKAVAQSLLGGKDFRGNVVTDRYKAYRCYPMEKRCICHAHLLRDYQKIIDRGGPGVTVGEGLLKLEGNIFHEWHAFQRGEIDRNALQLRLSEIAKPYGEFLLSGMECTDSKVAGMCGDILEHWPAIFAFGWVEGAEPTNNTGEREIRLGVRLRNNCFGTQSETGSRFVESVLSVITTCRRQGRNALQFLTETLTAWHAGTVLPSLVVVPGG